MANQMGFRRLVDKVRQQIKGHQEGLILPFEPESPTGQAGEASAQIDTGSPLEIDNELLITAEIVKLYPGLSNALGRVVLIDQLPSKGNHHINASAFGIQVQVDVALAEHMRAAYIRREESWL
jgi:hypothetical protein